MARHRSFSFEFKRRVVSDILERGVAMREIARQHSLARNLIRRWIEKYEAGQLTDEVANAGRIAEYEVKIAALERKVGQLTMEIDLLKKSARWEQQLSGENYSVVSGPGPSPSRKDAES